ncbi:MAG TPA: acyl-CoA desaturase [Solirubrobacteraceae bacterium]|jgi:linoleoyl-CoA desaturase|nr:acyl-CoA desaturase [Solirubrobacteraceae bacterium]
MSTMQTISEPNVNRWQSAELPPLPGAGDHAEGARSAADQPDEQSPLTRLSPEQLEQLGRELDAIREEVVADLGESDARYIRNLIKNHRRLVIAARAVLAGSRSKPGWLVGATALSVAKILENMEIGHNVMHGQWDWMNDPDINSRSWDWDTASPADAWRHSHNYEHHTYTNIRGKDRDLGYEIMRIDPHQPWHPVYLLQPLYNLLLMGFFEWGVALHDLNFDAIRSGEKSKAQVLGELKAIGGKARRQAIKDYIAFPLLSALTATAGDGVGSRASGSPGNSARVQRGSAALRWGSGARRSRARHAFKATLAANFTANIVRNVWAHSIIFCGHFPEQTYTFSQQEVADETRGGWYVRQLLGSANIDGSPLFHLMSGNLSFQVEHHLYPDLPSNRYHQIAPRVREVCERYGLPYNTGPLGQQLGSVHRTILRLAFPGGRPRRKATNS